MEWNGRTCRCCGDGTPAQGRTMGAPCIEGGCPPEDACRRTTEDAMAVTVERKGAAMEENPRCETCGHRLELEWDEDPAGSENPVSFWEHATLEEHEACMGLATAA